MHDEIQNPVREDGHGHQNGHGVVLHHDPSKHCIGKRRPDERRNETVGVRHVDELEVRRRRVIRHDVESLDPHEGEREEQNVEELNG